MVVSFFLGTRLRAVREAPAAVIGNAGELVRHFRAREPIGQF
jgi:hypothetical protein